MDVVRTREEKEKLLNFALDTLNYIDFWMCTYVPSAPPSLKGLSFIAGGFLRDLYFNKEIKDLDIFVPLGTPILVARGNMRFYTPTSSYPYIIDKSVISSKYENGVIATYILKPHEDHPIQIPLNIIMLEKGITAETCLKTFPCDISQFAITADGEHYQPFINAIVNGMEIAWYTPAPDYEYRIRKKYPEFHLMPGGSPGAYFERVL